MFLKALPRFIQLRFQNRYTYLTLFSSFIDNFHMKQYGKIICSHAFAIDFHHCSVTLFFTIILYHFSLSLFLPLFFTTCFCSLPQFFGIILWYHSLPLFFTTCFCSLPQFFGIVLYHCFLPLYPYHHHHCCWTSIDHGLYLCKLPPCSSLHPAATIPILDASKNASMSLRCLRLK